MSNVAVVYWSQTGNTESMAQAIAQAADTEALDYSEFSSDKVAEYDAFAFGCPAMGDEELDPDFEELWDECVDAFEDKPVVLFGSYDWGTGEWMENWKANAESAGVNVIETIIANLEPDDDVLEELRAAGEKLAE